ncbi:MAG: nuclear transport factor 2 family protein, partial [Dehalococcoidia bacterium]
FQASVNSGDFTALISFFTPDAGIDSMLAPGGASGADQILAYYQKLPQMSGFTVETSNLVESDPYVDVDWRFRAAPGSLRGYLDGHDSFTVQDGLITALSTQADVDAVAGSFMPPPAAPPASGAPVAKTHVAIEFFHYTPQVITVPVGARVTWTNNDADIHTVTTDDRSIDSGLIEQDVTVSLTFPVAGTYSYYCTTHPGMRGLIVVGGQ